MSLKLSHENTASMASLTDWDTDGSKPNSGVDDFLDMWLEGTADKAMPSSRSPPKPSSKLSTENWDWPGSPAVGTETNLAADNFASGGAKSHSDYEAEDAEADFVGGGQFDAWGWPVVGSPSGQGAIRTNLVSTVRLDYMCRAR